MQSSTCTLNTRLVIVPLTQEVALAQPHRAPNGGGGNEHGDTVHARLGAPPSTDAPHQSLHTVARELSTHLPVLEVRRTMSVDNRQYHSFARLSPCECEASRVASQGVQVCAILMCGVWRAQETHMCSCSTQALSLCSVLSVTDLLLQTESFR